MNIASTGSQTVRGAGSVGTPRVPVWGSPETDLFECTWVGAVQAWENRIAGRSGWDELEAAADALAHACAPAAHLAGAWRALRLLWPGARVRGLAPVGRAALIDQAGWVRMVSQGLCRLKEAGSNPLKPWSVEICREELRLCAAWARASTWTDEPALRHATARGFDDVELLLAREIQVGLHLLASGSWLACERQLATVQAAAQALGRPELARETEGALILARSSLARTAQAHPASVPLSTFVASAALAPDPFWKGADPDVAAVFEIESLALAGALEGAARDARVNQLVPFEVLRCAHALGSLGRTVGLDALHALSANIEDWAQSKIDVARPARDDELHALRLASAQVLLVVRAAVERREAIEPDFTTAEWLSLHALEAPVLTSAPSYIPAPVQLSQPLAEPVVWPVPRLDPVEVPLGPIERLAAFDVLNSLDALDSLGMDLGLELGEHSPRPNDESELLAAEQRLAVQNELDTKLQAELRAAGIFEPEGSAPGLALNASAVGSGSSNRRDVPSGAGAGVDPVLGESKLDWEILPGFLVEAAELMVALESDLEKFDPTRPQFVEFNRNVHTLKGGARMAGAMDLGDLLHGLEEDTLASRPSPERARGIAVFARECIDTAHRMLANLKSRWEARQLELAAAKSGGDKGVRISVDSSEIALLEGLMSQTDSARLLLQREAHRGLAEMSQMTLVEARLGRIADAIMVEAETRIASTTGPARAGFDALEFDAFGELHEHTRRLQEAVSDVGDILQAARARLESVNDLAGSLALSAIESGERVKALGRAPLWRLESKLRALARQTGRELGKPCGLEVRAVRVFLERSVLDRLSPALEHIVRNAIAHGIENPTVRLAAGKPLDGKITILAKADGRNVEILLSDDGAGVNFERVRSKGMALGLIPADASRTRLLELLFDAGFSTASSVSEIAGRGVGLDAVAHIIGSLGGSVQIESEQGVGATFKIRLPLALSSVSGIVARIGSARYAVPSAMILGMDIFEAPALAERMLSQESLPGSYGSFVPVWLGDWVGMPMEGHKLVGQTLLLRGAEVGLCAESFEYVDGLPIQAFDHGQVPVGLLGYGHSGDGSVVAVLNPLALLESRARLGRPEPLQAPVLAPLILVVDDSVTIRKVTARHLIQAGFRVSTAENGQVALVRAQTERPVAILMDIEMPVMDGFESLASLKADPLTRGIEVIMISSRVGERHRTRARELGALAFLGKPYDKEELIALIESLAPQALAPSRKL